MNQLTKRTKSSFSVQDPRVNISTVGLTLLGEITFEEWSQLGPNLALLERSMRWAIADWLNYGERRYGEMYAQAIDTTGLDYHYLANLKWLAGNVEISRRREELGLSHHAVVAPLSPEEQEAWLQYAIDNNLTRDEFRTAVKLATAESDTDPQSQLTAPNFNANVKGLVLSMLRAEKAGKREIVRSYLYELMEVLDPWI